MISETMCSRRPTRRSIVTLFVILALCGITTVLQVHAESDVRQSIDQLQSQSKRIHTRQSKLRISGVKGRDLQTGATKSLAQAIANGLRMPSSTKKKQKQSAPAEEYRVQTLSANSM